MDVKRFETITGRLIDLDHLSVDERRFLEAVRHRYATKPEWTAFGSWWTAELHRQGLSEDSICYRVCQDLEARLGISQGKVAPPGYRDYLADLIDDRFGSRYRFCKETGIDPGHLSRVLAGAAELSLPSLQNIADALQAALVIQPRGVIQERLDAETASRTLDRALAA